MNDLLTGIILAGGKSRRLGRDKALELFNERPLIFSVIDAIRSSVDEIILIVNDSARKKELAFIKNVKIVVDTYIDSGSLGGIYSGLLEAKNSNAIVLACDMPFVSKNIINTMKNRMGSNVDIVIPETDGYKHSTHAIYNKNCLEVIDQQLKQNEYKISKIFSKCKTIIITENEIDEIEPNSKSFFNINNESDLDKANQIFSTMGKIKIKIEFFGTAKLVAKQDFIHLYTKKQVTENELIKLISKAKPDLIGQIIKKDTNELKKSYNLGINGIKNISDKKIFLQKNDSILIFSSQSGG